MNQNRFITYIQWKLNLFLLLFEVPILISNYFCWSSAKTDFFVMNVNSDVIEVTRKNMIWHSCFVRLIFRDTFNKSNSHFWINHGLKESSNEQQLWLKSYVIINISKATRSRSHYILTTIELLYSIWSNYRNEVEIFKLFHVTPVWVY